MLKVVRVVFSIALVGWTLFSLAGVILSLLLDGPETAFLILWAAFAALALFVWISIEGGIWLYRRLSVRMTRIDAPPPVPQEQWRTEDAMPAAAPPDPAPQDDPWAHAPDYEVSEDQPNRPDDEFPTIKEQFPRL